MNRGDGTIWKRGRIWWVRVYVAGRPVERSSRSQKYEDARRLKDKLLGQRARGELGGPHSTITVGGLLDQFFEMLAVRVRPNTFAIQKMVAEAHVRPYFGAKKAEKITTTLLLSYRAYRESEQAKPVTVNRELSLLRNCMRSCAYATPALIPVSCIPRFPISNEDAFARQGFLEDEKFDLLVAELPSYLVPIATVAYNTGVRKGELVKITWDQVDFDSRVLRLYRGHTKTGDPRTVPMIGRMEEVLLAAKQQRDEFWPASPWVFQRLGVRLNDFHALGMPPAVAPAFPILTSMTSAVPGCATFPVRAYPSA